MSSKLICFMKKMTCLKEDNTFVIHYEKKTVITNNSLEVAVRSMERTV